MPRETLTRDQIVKAAVDLLDAEGLEGLNMRALGKRLDAAATAMYWHVGGGKDDLIELAGDQVWAEIALPDPAEVGWRSAAVSMAGDLYAMLTRHLWLVQAFGQYVFNGAGKARHHDHTLAVFEAAGFVGAEADQASAGVYTYVLGNALGVAAKASLVRKLGRNGADAEAAINESMAKAREVSARFPHLRERLETPGADYASAPDNSFAFGLEALLDGLEARLAARAEQRQ